MIPNWHIKVFADELQVAAERVFRNEPAPYDLVTNTCFGTSKSTIFSILFQPWTWTRMPTARHINATHTDGLVMDFADKSLQVMLSAKYKRLFPEIKMRRSAVGAFANTLGGDRLACTVGGKTPTGFHGHFLGVDDPLDPKRAASEVELKNASDFITNVLPSRKLDKKTAFTFEVMQRLRVGDPSDVMLEVGRREGARKVRHICLPGELTTGVQPPELAAKYIDGLLDPVRLPRSVLNEYKATLGQYGYQAQVLQQPVSMTGGMFKAGFFTQHVTAAPYAAKRVRYWDRAATENGGCATCGTLMSRGSDGNYYVENVVHGHWEPDERDATILAAAQRDRLRYGPSNEPDIWVEQEPGSSGVDSFKYLSRKLAGYKVFSDRPTGSKAVRAEPWASQCAAKNVFLVADGTWQVAEWIAEHLAFPLGKLMDRVDSASGAFTKLHKSGKPLHGLRTVTFGSKKHAGLHIAVGTAEQLATLAIQHRVVLVTLDEVAISGAEYSAPDTSAKSEATCVTQDILSEEKYHNGHVLCSLAPPYLIDSHSMAFADLQPSELQADWPADRLLEPWNRPVAEVLVSADQAKRLWSFLLRKRPSPYDVIVIGGGEDGDRRPLSVACAVCDALNLQRIAIHVIGTETQYTDAAPNRYVYDMVKRGRSMVVG